MIVQKLRKEFEDQVSLAQKYYIIISGLNNIPLTSRDVDVLSFTAVNGCIDRSVKKKFCKEYNTSPATINNVISKLKKLGMIVKNNKLTIVNPLICLDFSKDVGLDIRLIHGK